MEPSTCLAATLCECLAALLPQFATAQQLAAGLSTQPNAAQLSRFCEPTGLALHVYLDQQATSGKSNRCAGPVAASSGTESQTPSVQRRGIDTNSSLVAAAVRAECDPRDAHEPPACVIFYKAAPGTALVGASSLAGQLRGVYLCSSASTTPLTVDGTALPTSLHALVSGVVLPLIHSAVHGAVEKDAGGAADSENSVAHRRAARVSATRSRNLAEAEQHLQVSVQALQKASTGGRRIVSAAEGAATLTAGQPRLSPLVPEQEIGRLCRVAEERAAAAAAAAPGGARPPPHPLSTVSAEIDALAADGALLDRLQECLLRWRTSTARTLGAAAAELRAARRPGALTSSGGSGTIFERLFAGAEDAFVRDSRVRELADVVLDVSASGGNGGTGGPVAHTCSPVAVTLAVLRRGGLGGLADSFMRDVGEAVRKGAAATAHSVALVRPLLHGLELLEAVWEGDVSAAGGSSSDDSASGVAQHLQLVQQQLDASVSAFAGGWSALSKLLRAAMASGADSERAAALLAGCTAALARAVVKGLVVPPDVSAPSDLPTAAPASSSASAWRLPPAAAAATATAVSSLRFRWEREIGVDARAAIADVRRFRDITRIVGVVVGEERATAGPPAPPCCRSHGMTMAMLRGRRHRLVVLAAAGALVVVAVTAAPAAGATSCSCWSSG